MRKTLPILATTALLLSPAVASVAHADTPVVHDVTTSADSNRVYSTITVAGQWHIDNPAAGDSFTVELGNGLTWPTGTTFPLTERTTGAQVATCTATAGTSTLTCEFNATSEQWDTLDGNFQASAQINAAAIGTSTSTIVVAGASIPVNFPGAIVGQKADPTTYKGGWYAGDTKDGLHRFDWFINVSGATDYVVSDPGATVRSVQCTDADWSSAYSVRYAVNGVVTVFSAPHTTSVCRVKVTTVTADSTTSNTAAVNGTAYKAQARVSANGSGEGDGSNTPTPTQEPSAEPTPTQEATTPAATETPSDAPSEEPMPAPTPTSTATPTTETHSWPTPSSSPSPSSASPAPSQQPSPSPSAQSSTTASAEPTAASTLSSTPSSTTPKHTATSPNTPSKSPAASTIERSLAHTGADGWLAAFAVALLACGAAVYTINRPKH